MRSLIRPGKTKAFSCTPQLHVPELTRSFWRQRTVLFQPRQPSPCSQNTQQYTQPRGKGSNTGCVVTDTSPTKAGWYKGHSQPALVGAHSWGLTFFTRLPRTPTTELQNCLGTSVTEVGASDGPSLEELKEGCESARTRASGLLAFTHPCSQVTLSRCSVLPGERQRCLHAQFISSLRLGHHAQASQEQDCKKNTRRRGQIHYFF